MKKFDNELEALNQIAYDLNVIKCLLITDFAESRNESASKLNEDIRKIYGIDEEEEVEKE